MYKFTTASVNLMSEKSKTSNVVTVIPKYSKVEALELDDEWSKVRFNGNQVYEGYVVNDYLSRTMETWSNVSLRDKESIYSKVITIIPTESSVEVLSKYGDWSYIYYNDLLGYVFNYYLSDDGKPRNILYYSNFYNTIEFVNSNDLRSPTEYMLITDLKNRLTYVLNKIDNMWKIVYKWSCTIGKPSTPTIVGVFNISGRKPGFGTSVYSVKYATRIKGPYYYHSILYDSTGKYIKDGRLGQALSHGCVRLATENAKWIYDNIPDKTTVVIH